MPYRRRIVTCAPGSDDPVGPDAAVPELDTGTFSVHVARSGGRVTLVLAGELDLAGTDALLRIAQSWLTRAAPAELVVDLGALDFMDSSGIRSLLELEELASECGSEFALLAPRPAVLRVLEITALLDHFRIE
jgi:anti-anti-sigma factor